MAAAIWRLQSQDRAAAGAVGPARRTKVALVYKKTGNLRACQLLLDHRKLDSTVRYRGIEVDDALALSEPVDLLPTAEVGEMVVRSALFG